MLNPRAYYSCAVNPEMNQFYIFFKSTYFFWPSSPIPSVRGLTAAQLVSDTASDGHLATRNLCEINI